MQLSHWTEADDLFVESSRMSFGSHLEELRVCLWRAILGFVAILVLVFVLDFLGSITNLPIGVGKPMLDVSCQPVVQELHQFHARRLERVRAKLAIDPPPPLVLELDLRQAASALGLSGGEQTAAVVVPARVPVAAWKDLQDLSLGIDRRPGLRTLSVTEGMVVYFKVAAACGVVLGCPWIAYQLWIFIAAGLYPSERRYVQWYLPFSVALFLAGVVICQLLVMPKTVEALLWFNEWLGLEPELRLGEWLGFATMMPLVFGVAFQTPLAMLMLERIGVFGVEDYRKHRRITWFVMAIVAAMITPSTDPLSLVYLWLPIVLLYELGIVLCRLRTAST